MDTLQFMNWNMTTYARLDRPYRDTYYGIIRTPPKYLKIDPTWKEHCDHKYEEVRKGENDEDM